MTVNQNSVVIVGGGLAGQAAALALQSQRWRVTLLESRRVLGGRVGSFDDSQSKLTVDYCQHLGMACCTNLVGLMQNLGLAEYWRREASLHFYSSTGKELRFQGSQLPAPLHLSQLLLAWPQLSWTERIRIGIGLWKLMRLKLDSATSSESAMEWLLKHNQTEATLKKFWSTILVSALGDQVDRVTMGLVRKVLIDGFAANRQAYQLLVPTLPLRQLCGDLVAAKLVNEGIEIRTNATAEKVVWQDSQAQAIRLTSGETIAAEAVVIAVPWYRASKLLQHGDVNVPSSVLEVGERLSRVESSPITGIHTWWDRDWLRTPHAILVDRFCQWIFRSSAPQEPTAQGHYLQIVISGSRDLPRGDQEATIQAMLADLAEVFPSSRGASLLRWRIVTDPQAVFTLTPGSTAWRPKVDQLAEHRLWLCGDWTDTGWPATMEGAVRSGHLAAEAIERWKGKTTRFCATDLRPGWLARRVIR